MTEMNIVLETEERFCAAHRLVGYQGDCKRIHGHSFKVEVVVVGNRSLRDQVGMLMDFKFIKTVIKRLDHKAILKKCKQNEMLIAAIRLVDGEGVVELDYNPTAENLAMYLWKEFKKVDERFDYAVKVYESETSSASVGEINVQK